MTPMTPMKILIACEWSGTVRDAFRRKGHDVVSCDNSPEEWNRADYRCDVRDLLGDGWDLLIGHPPCTALTVAGNRYYADKPELIKDAFSFFLSLWNSGVPRVCLENPVGRISTLFRPPDQYIQPWQFGEDASKKTGLWLRGLPPLVPTRIVEPGSNGRFANQTPSGQNKLGPSPDRARLRGQTYLGIAEAMADQWG